MEYRVVVDQMGHRIEVPQCPQRIVSLVPSQTELLFDLALEERIAGITKFCIHPSDKVKQYPKIGGTKNFNFDRIEKLQPDLIIGNKEENYQEGIEKLKEKYPVWMSDIVTLEDSLDMMRSIGDLTQTNDKAEKLIKGIQSEFSPLMKPRKLQKAVYLIWHKPDMAVGQGTFINEMLPLAGFDNPVEAKRYPELTEEQLTDFNPAYILLSSEPYPFKEKHIAYYQTLCPSAKVILVDGEMFSWYGSRLRFAPKYFEKLLAT